MRRARTEIGPHGEIRIRIPLEANPRFSVSTLWNAHQHGHLKEALARVDQVNGYLVNNQVGMIASKLFPQNTRLRELVCRQEPDLAPPLTVGDLLERVRDKYRQNHLNNYKKVKHAIDPVIEFLGKKRAKDLTAKEVWEFVEHRQNAPLKGWGNAGKKGYALATINQNLSMLSGAYTLAKEHGQINYDGPKMPFFKNIQNARTGFFEPEVLAAFLRHLPDDTPQHPGPNLRLLVKVMYVTGWRISELLTRKTRGGHLNMKEGWLRLEPGETKNKKGRQFPFETFPELREYLQAQLDYTREFCIRERHFGDVEWLFHRQGEELKYSVFYLWWRKAQAAVDAERVAAGLKPLGKNMLAHDFRRTCARNMRARGLSPDIAMRLLGWSTWSMWERYAIVDEDTLKEAIAKLAREGRLLPLPPAVLPSLSPEKLGVAKNP